jgi:hypothetical protein
MIGIAVAVCMFATCLISFFRWKKMDLKGWRWPLRFIMLSSAGWMIYLALTDRLH